MEEAEASKCRAVLRGHHGAIATRVRMDAKWDFVGIRGHQPWCG